MDRGIVFDPLYKIEVMNYFFPKIYKEGFDCEFEKVKIICKDLVRKYEIIMNDKKLVFPPPLKK